MTFYNATKGEVDMIDQGLKSMTPQETAVVGL